MTASRLFVSGTIITVTIVAVFIVLNQKSSRFFPEGIRSSFLVPSHSEEVGSTIPAPLEYSEVKSPPPIMNPSIESDAPGVTVPVFVNKLILEQAMIEDAPGEKNLASADDNLLVHNDLETPKKSEKLSNRLPLQPGATWQWQLDGRIDTTHLVDMYDVDLFETPQSAIDELRGRGVVVICYFSAGTNESYRSDSDRFPLESIGKSLDDWPDEKWLNVSRYYQFSQIMIERLDLAVEKRCDGVEPDNVDGYQNSSGFDISYDDQLKYNRWLSKEAHGRGLLVALKNDLEQVADLVDNFDFAVNEQCFRYEECEYLRPFVASGKPVFGVEYELALDEFCSKAISLGFSWLKKSYDLGPESTAC